MNENGEDQGGPSKGKPWERPWTTDEMRQNAQSWNLAGDAGLLKHLQEFSQTVLSRTHTTEKALDSLVEEVNNLTSEANTTNNKFLCLANTQFVENRVYDDDDKETPQTETIPEKKSKEDTEAKMLQKVREALSMSVAVLDTMFEPVDIQASDSEGEMESDKQGTKNLILEPHNPYIHRPLPHLIGSEAFMTDDHIGLGDSPSDGEEQPIADDDMDGSIDSDVDFTVPGANKRGRDLYSSQSSVSDHGLHRDENPRKIKPVDPAHESVNDPEDAMASTSSPAQENSDFASQLAAKLGKIAAPPNASLSNNDAGSSHKKLPDDMFGGGVSDEEDDILFPRSNNNLFGGRGKLFDDLEDTNQSLWGTTADEKSKISNQETLKTEQPIDKKVPFSRTNDNLFSSGIFDDDDDDDLFPTKVTQKPKTIENKDLTKKEYESISAITSKQPPLKRVTGEGLTSGILESGVRDPDDLYRSSGNVAEDLSRNADVDTSGDKSDQSVAKSVGQTQNHERKPTGGVPMFGQADVLAGLKAKFPRRPSTSSSEGSSGEPAGNRDSTLAPSVHDSSVERNLRDGKSSTNSSTLSKSDSGTIKTSPPILPSSRISNDGGYGPKTISKPKPAASNQESGSDDDDLFSSKSSNLPSQLLFQPTGGLFSEENDDEDDLFAPTKPSKVEPKKETADLQQKNLDKTQSEREPSSIPSATISSTASKSVTVTDTSKSRPEKSQAPMDFGRNDIYSTVPPPLKSESKVKKPVSLFDDSDSGEDEFLFSSASSAGSRRSQASTDILASSAISTIEKKPLAKKGLFDDDEKLFASTYNDPDIDIFSESARPSSKTNSTPRSSQPPLSSSVVEDHPRQNEGGASVQTQSMQNSILGKAHQPQLNKSILEDDLFAVDEEGDDLFISSSNDTLPNARIATANLKRQIVGNDLLQDVSGEKHTAQENSLYSSSKSAKESPQSQFVDSASLSAEKEMQPSTENYSRDSLKKEGALTSTDKNISTGLKYGLKGESSQKESLPETNHLPAKKPIPPQTLDIRRETDPGLGLLGESDDEDDVLFGSSTSKVVKKPTPLPKHSQKPSVAAKPTSVSATASETASNSNLSFSKTIESGNQKVESSEVDGTTVKVSKLRDSLLAGGLGQPPLKIDPAALLPGMKPPRFTPPRESNYGSSVAEEKKTSVIPSAEKPVSFDEPLLNNSTLPSANKDRAKLGVKRRPPSNKARRDAARASQSFDQSDRDSPISPEGSGVAKGTITTESTNISNSILSPSTDEDDLFGVPLDLPAEYGNRSVPYTDIFGGTPILSPMVSNTLAEALDQHSERKQKLDEPLEKKISSQDVKEEILFTASHDVGQSKREELFASSLDKQLSEQGHEPIETLGVKTSKSKDPSDSSPELNVTSSSHMQSSKSTETVSSPQSQREVLPNNPKHSQSNSNGEDEAISTLSASSTIDFSKPSNAEVPNLAPVLDPLNKIEHPTDNDEDELFGSGSKTVVAENHSSLFPFVKKKPESKPSSKDPLFSQTPTLPSKAEKYHPKAGLGGLDDVGDDDLFSSSSKVISTKNSQDVASSLISKGRESKMWNFSDEDDDENLFASGQKSLAASISSKANTSASVVPAAAENKIKDKVEGSVGPGSGETKLKSGKFEPQNGLFADDSEDNKDDLFSKASQFSKGKLKNNLPLKSSLFDDDDDGDDLFGSKPVPKINKSLQSKTINAPGNNPPASSSSKKKTEDVFDDPLMAQQSDS